MGRIGEKLVDAQGHLDQRMENLPLAVGFKNSFIDITAAEHLENCRMTVGAGYHRGGRNHRSVGASHTRGPPVLNRHRRRPGVQSQDAAEAGIAAGNGR